MIERKQLLPYFAIAALVALAALANGAISLFYERNPLPFAFYLLAVVVAAWAGGARLGLTALALGAAAALATSPSGTFTSADGGGRSLARLAAFLIESAVICLFAGLSHSAQAHAERRRRQAEDAQRETQRSLDALRRAQDALATSRQQFRRLMDANLIGMFTLSADGTLLGANDAFLTMLDLSAADVHAGQIKFDILTSSEPQRPPRRIYEELAATGRYPPRERKMGRPDGPCKPVLLGATSFDGPDEPAIGIAVDLTELKRTEAALREAIGEAETASRAKSEFLANISHELRTPMNAIIGMTDLALQAELPAEAAENLQIARESADALLRVLNDLLDFARIESGRFNLIDEPFTLEAALLSTVRAMALRAYAKGLEINVRIRPNVPQQLNGDSLRLCQVLANLLSNAIKFTDQGEINIEVEVQRQQRDRVRLQFSVSDTGIGIAPQNQTMIFAPFTQVDSSSTRMHHGSGLGLAIASELVALMQGRLWVESAPGAGSRFYFTAELAALDAPPDGDARERLIPLNGRRALVVDDNATTRSIVAEILDGCGLRPVTVATGSQALATLTEPTDDPFAVVVADALMPGMDGFELAALMAADPALRRPLVMLLSAYDHRQFAARCAETAAAIVEKPLAATELAAALAMAACGVPLPRVAQPGLAADVPPLVAQILVTEDTPANQKVIDRVLRKRGHEVTVAHNGRQALELCRQKRFDVVLMDVQMPTMDGFQATAGIRALPTPAPVGATAGNVPVVALTAHVMKGDRERCLEAGMDAYLAKPIDAHQAVALIERLALQYRGGTHKTNTDHPAAETATLPVASSDESQDDDAPPTIDLDATLRRLEGDRQLLTDIVQLFLEDSPALLETIDANLQSGDAEQVERAAHSLKGLAANLDAKATMAAAWAVEQAARRQQLAEAAELNKALRMQVDRLCALLVDMSKTASA